jgi:DNA-directed RNA polymerase subunit L
LQLKINSLSKEAIQVQIDGEDYSICDILHKELLNLKHVKFAGVAPPHPLIKTLTLQFHTDGADGNKILAEAIQNANKKLDDLLRLGQQSFPMPKRPAGPTEQGLDSRPEIIEPGPVRSDQTESAPPASP